MKHTITKTKLPNLEYEYVFRDKEELINQIDSDLMETYCLKEDDGTDKLFGLNHLGFPFEYDIYETEDKIIVEPHRLYFS